MIWKRTRDTFWAISPNVLEEVLEQAKLENKGLARFLYYLEKKHKQQRKK